MLFHNKKAQEGGSPLETLIGIVLISVSFALIVLFIKSCVSEAEGATADAICRTSVAARERANADLVVINIKLYPLLCKTQDIVIEPKTNNPKEEINKKIADMMATTWYTFGEGLAKNLFDERIWIGGNKCFYYYTFKIKESKDFKKGDKMPQAELEDWISFNPYKVKVIENENAKTICEKNGGECILGVCGGDKKPYPWNCGAGGKTCCVKEFVSYRDYIQNNVGPGKIVISNEDFEVGEVYAISILDPSNKLWKTKFSKFLGAEESPQVIYIDTLNEMKKNCNKVEDVS